MQMTVDPFPHLTNVYNRHQFFQIGISAELKKTTTFLTGKKEKPLKDEDPQGMNASYRKDGQAIDIEYTDYTDKISYST